MRIKEIIIIIIITIIIIIKTWSNTTLINLPRCFKDKPYFPINTPLNSLNFFHALPILALTTLDALP